MKLIPEWRQCHKFWSLRLQVLGVFLLGVLQAFPEVVAHVWLVLPAEIHSAIPDTTLRWIGYACLAAGIIARLIRQDAIHAGVGGQGERGVQGPGG